MKNNVSVIGISVVVVVITALLFGVLAQWMAPDELPEPVEAIEDSNAQIAEAPSVSSAAPPVAQPIRLPEPSRWDSTTSGIRVHDLVVGTGEMAQKDEVWVFDVTSWVVSTGALIESSELLGRPERAKVGGSRLLPGLEESLSTMRAGGERLVRVPPALAYGGAGVAGKVPRDAEVEYHILLRQILPARQIPESMVEAPPKSKWTTSSSGFKWVTLREGTGPEVGSPKSAKVKLDYTGWTLDGERLDSSLGGTDSVELVLGQALKCWSLGMRGAKAGEIRRLRCPPELAYGEAGFRGVVGPSDDVFFDIELVEVLSSGGTQ